MSRRDLFAKQVSTRSKWEEGSYERLRPQHRKGRSKELKLPHGLIYGEEALALKADMLNASLDVR
jgi:hypothetical protein